METLFMVLSLNIQREPSEDDWPLQGFFKVSQILAEFFIMILFHRCEEYQVSQELWGQISASVNFL